MDRIRVHASHVTAAFLCSSCAEWRETGRAYDLLVNCEGTAGVITLCQSCRDDFHRADLELEAPEMEADYRRRQNETPLVSEAACEFLRPSQHLTFPPDKR